MYDMTNTADALKLLSLLFITAALVARGRNRRILWMVMFVVLAASAVAHGLRDGWAGIRYEVLGISLACLCTLPLHLLGSIDRTDLAASAAAGAILGSLGFLYILFVAVVILVAQKLLGAELGPAKPVWPEQPEISLAADTELEERSALSIIEARRTFRLRERAHGGLCGTRREETAREPILPWSMKIAFGTLALLITGIPL